jgi:hypothetical protein
MATMTRARCFSVRPEPLASKFLVRQRSRMRVKLQTSEAAVDASVNQKALPFSNPSSLA